MPVPVLNCVKLEQYSEFFQIKKVVLKRETRLKKGGLLNQPPFSLSYQVIAC